MYADMIMIIGEQEINVQKQIKKVHIGASNKILTSEIKATGTQNNLHIIRSVILSRYASSQYDQNGRANPSNDSTVPEALLVIGKRMRDFHV